MFYISSLADDRYHFYPWVAMIYLKNWDVESSKLRSITKKDVFKQVSFSTR